MVQNKEEGRKAGFTEAGVYGTFQTRSSML
jgi:hypothetical protein